MSKTYQINTVGGTMNGAYHSMINQTHLLIAGTTGSGKSVLLNNLIYTSLATYNYYIFIDTKMTELGMYKNLPQTMFYETSVEGAKKAIQYALDLVRERAKKTAANDSRKSDEKPLYIIIDELGDLVMTDPTITKILGQIAMLGRASNVHIIAATQCPNRKTLSPELLANCPSRVALRCQNAIESRQIIGTPDAVNLPKYGECIYYSPDFGTAGIVDVAVTPDEVIKQRVEHYTKQAPARMASPEGITPAVVGEAILQTICKSKWLTIGLVSFLAFCLYELVTMF